MLFRQCPLLEARLIANKTSNDGQEADDQLVSRLAKLFDVQKRSAQEQWHGGLTDKFDVNVMLRLINEDKSPMDIDQALNFFGRNSLAINTRWNQLRQSPGDYPSEYLPYMVPRHEFPVPKIQINESDGYMSWSLVLAGLTFDGAESSNTNPKLQWRAKSNAARSLQRRQKRSTPDVSGHVLHEVYGN